MFALVTIGGITLWVRADSGTRFYYAHNSRNVVRVRGRVGVGRVIAYVGDTGNARGCTPPPVQHGTVRNRDTQQG